MINAIQPARWQKKISDISQLQYIEFVILAGITFLAIVLRMYRLGEWSFWIDEIFTIIRVQEEFGSLEKLRQHLPLDTSIFPISFILTAQALNLFGVSEWSARLVSTMIGIATIPILYFPLKKIFGNQVTLIALLLLAVSPWHIFWSQNARFYTLLMLFYTLALITVYFGLERDRPIYFGIFYILFYLAFSERVIAVVIIPVVALYLFLLWILPLEKPRGFKIKNVLILSSPIIIFAVYQLVLFITTGSYMFASAVAALAPPIDNPIRLLILIVFSMGVPLTIFASFTGIYLLSSNDRTILFLLISAVLPVILFMIATPYFFIVERYAFVTLIFWIVLASIGLTVISSMVKKHAFILILGILFVFLSDAAGENLLYYQTNDGNRLDWQGAVGYVQESMKEGDIIVSTRAALASYYLGGEVLEYTELLPSDLENIGKQIWFIMDYPGIWHGNHLTKEWVENNARLEKFSYLRVREENVLLVYHFDPGLN
jgi:mannosyltransferase